MRATPTVPRSRYQLSNHFLVLSEELPIWRFTTGDSIRVHRGGAHDVQLEHLDGSSRGFFWERSMGVTEYGEVGKDECFVGRLLNINWYLANLRNGGGHRHKLIQVAINEGYTVLNFTWVCLNAGEPSWKRFAFALLTAGRCHVLNMQAG